MCQPMRDIVYTDIGELTEYGYTVRKQRIEEANDDISEVTVTHSASEMTPKTMKLNEAINKLFGCHQGLPSKNKAKGQACAGKKRCNSSDSEVVAEAASNVYEPPKKRPKVQKSNFLEVICMPVETQAIPRGEYKSKLEEGGLVKFLVYKDSDTASLIHAKIIALFTNVFTAKNNQFLFMSASSKHLELPFNLLLVILNGME